MVDACLITRGTGTPVWDETTGTWSAPGAVTVYSGKCKLQTQNVAVNEADVAGREVGLVLHRLDLPVDGSGQVARGDTATMTACRLDASVVGRSFTVEGPHRGSGKTARRLPVRAVV